MRQMQIHLLASPLLDPQILLVHHLNQAGTLKPFSLGYNLHFRQMLYQPYKTTSQNRSDTPLKT